MKHRAELQTDNAAAIVATNGRCKQSIVPEWRVKLFTCYAETTAHWLINEQQAKASVPGTCILACSFHMSAMGLNACWCSPGLGDSCRLSFTQNWAQFIQVAKHAGTPWASL